MEQLVDLWMGSGDRKRGKEEPFFCWGVTTNTLMCRVERRGGKQRLQRAKQRPNQLQLQQRRESNTCS